MAERGLYDTLIRADAHCFLTQTEPDNNSSEKRANFAFSLHHTVRLCSSAGLTTYKGTSGMTDATLVKTLLSLVKSLIRT